MKERNKIQIMTVVLVGEIIPGFALLSTNCMRVRVTGYRGRRNIVLIFGGTGCCESVRSLVRLMSELYSEFLAEDVELFAVAQGVGRGGEDLGVGCSSTLPVLMYREGHAHELLGALGSGQDSFPVVCVIDHYGEVRYATPAADSQASCAARDILDWVRYINLECPE